jgi:glutamine cyclotransferase
VFYAKTFKNLKVIDWPHDGWGMTTDGKELIISEGSSNLYFVNPDNFKINRIVGVTNNYGPVGNVNELEYVNGVIYANIWQTNNIIKIDPQTGKVLAQLDLTGILDSSGMPYNHNRAEVLNGIAYDPAKNIFYVTGKYWPALFEIKLN